MVDYGEETPSVSAEQGVEEATVETQAAEVIGESAFEFYKTAEGEEVLEDEDELVWRQCAPGHFDTSTGKPTLDLFRPNEADSGMMSGSRKSKTTAERAYKHRVEVDQKLSKGTWAVSVAEVDKVDARVVDDSANLKPPPAPPPGHVFIDVRHLKDLDKRERLRFRSTLLIFANKRGRQFPAP